jgi:WD40 repeat protein
MTDHLSEPYLTIETGAHRGRVVGFDLDAAGSLLLTASDDKTARLWSVPSLRPLGVLRPRLLNDLYAPLFAAALSKDGSMGAVAGYSDGPLAIDMFDVARCEIVQQVTVPEVTRGSVLALRFSPDRALLVVGTAENGLMVVSIADGAIIGRDETFDGSVLALDFSPDGVMLAASSDGVVHLYEAARLHGKPLPKWRAKTVAGQRSFSIRFAPDGSALALGFEDDGVEVREASEDLALRWHRRPKGEDFRGRPYFSAVAWCDDGEGLLVSGNTSVVENQWIVMRANARDGGEGEWQTATRDVMHDAIGFMADLEPGRLIVSRSGEIALYGRDGARVEHVLPPNGDLRMDHDAENEAARAFRVSYDGTVAEWTFAVHWRAVRFDARNLTLESDTLAQRAGLAAWTEQRGAARVFDWRDSKAASLETAPGQRVALVANTGDSFCAVDVDHAHVLLGADLNLYRFGAEDGAPAGLRPIAHGALRVNQSPDGRLAVAALSDGTIRWFRLDDSLEELLAIFVTDEPLPRWVAFTQHGYYAAGAGAEDLIGWHLDRGPGRSVDFFPASAFRDRFHRPDVVKRVLATRDEMEALRQADEARGGARTPPSAQQVATLREDQPPTVTILTPREGALLPADGTLVIAAEVRAPVAKRVQEVLVRVDGGAAKFKSIVNPMSLANPALGEEASLRLLEVALGAEPRPQAVVEVFALDESQRGPSAIVTLRRPQTLQAIPEATTKPRLLAVLLGVTQYKEESLRKAVTFASKDAQDMARLLDRQRGVLYRDVVCRCLPEGATRDAVFEALGWLERESTGLDTALLFLAGHGMTWRRSTYYFLLAGASLQGPELQGLSGVELLGRMEAIGGKRLVMLDTCYAGAAGQPPPDWAPDADRLMNLLHSAGVPVFGATVANARAQERAALGNGVFTHALRKALDRPDRPLPFSELWTVLRREVGAVTCEQQNVSFLNAGIGADLALLAGTG